MPVYEYHCRDCAATFEKLRPMRAADETAVCPSGHAGATRTITTFATLSRAAERGVEMMAPAGGGCGGGGCACAAGMPHG